MTTKDDFVRQLAGWLREDSAHRVPEHLSEVLNRTAASRQRPWWASLPSWLPVDLSAPRAPRLTSGARRAILLAAALGLLLAALLVVAIGSRRPLPPPFGLARNGELVVSMDGDIVIVAPETGQIGPLIGGATVDFGPVFARDGARFSFLRGAPTPCGQPDCGLILAVANADGTGVRQITPGEPGLDELDWSPDGRHIAFLSAVSGTAGHVLNVVDVETARVTTLPVPFPVNQLSWRPPDGAEILFRGEQLRDSDPPPGIFAIRPDGTGLRPISSRQPQSPNDFNDVAVSPDGTRVAYREAAPERPFAVVLLDLATGVESVLPDPNGAGQGGPVFSPDGRSIAYLRWSFDRTTRLVVAPTDGSSLGIVLGPAGPVGPDGPTVGSYGFAPDGTAVFANYAAETVARLLPIDGSPGVVIARGDLAFPSYQRLAP